MFLGENLKNSSKNPALKGFFEKKFGTWVRTSTPLKKFFALVRGFEGGFLLEFPLYLFSSSKCIEKRHFTIFFTFERLKNRTVKNMRLNFKKMFFTEICAYKNVGKKQKWCHEKNALLICFFNFFYVSFFLMNFSQGEYIILLKKS